MTDETNDDLDFGYGDNGPTLPTLGAAIQCWSLTNITARSKDSAPTVPFTNWPTIGDAALAFCLPVDRIKQAVDWHPWMFATGDGADAELAIEHEGE